MRTWTEYKKHVKEVDSEAYRDIKEAELHAEIITAIIKQRKHLGLSQRNLATICGIPQSSVARIESNKTTPNLDTFLKMLKQLRLHIDVSPL